MFLFIYAPRLSVPFYINSSITIFLSFFIYYNKKLIYFKINSNLFILSLFLFFLALYNFGISLFYNNNPVYFTTILISNIIYLSFGVMFYFFLFKEINNNTIFDNTILFFKIVLTCIILNSLIIIFEFIIPSFKIALESILYNDYNNDNIIQYADHPFWKRGFASAGGAAQSVFSSTGILISFLLFKNNKISFFNTISCILIILLSVIFIGRTGIIISISYTLIFLFYFLSTILFKKTLSIIKIILSLFFFSLIFIFIFKQLDFDQGHLDWAFDWFDSKNGIVENQSFEGAKNHIYLPDNPIHLLFGKGFFEGEDADYPRTDSGYIKTILSIGLIFSIFLYFFIFYIFFKISISNKKLFTFFIILIFTLLITEFKEPFIYQNFLGRMIFSYLGFILVTIHNKTLT
jgi:hypothetical protein